MTRVAVLIALAFLFTTPTLAASRECGMAVHRTGYDLKAALELKLEDAIDREELVDVFGCSRYAHGNLQAVLDSSTGIAFDIPTEVSSGQRSDVYLKWARDHPEKLHLPASRCVIDAFAEVFPAEKPNPPEPRRQPKP